MKIFRMYSLFILALLGVCGEAYAQLTLKGIIKTGQNEPIVGANIFVKHSSAGTATDINGSFTLQVAQSFNDSTLVISSIGYATQEISIQERREFNVTMIEDTKTLAEVVVTGYQTEERGKILGAVASVSPELINKIPVSGIDQALQGRVPGVVVTQNTGAPGEGVIVRIRGVGSLNSNNQPLYVIDGIPTLDATMVSPQDMASAVVLKDASAAALYGSRAANGVILITTKIGTGSKQVIQYSSQMGVQSPTRLVPMANTNQYVSIFNEAATADNLGQPAFLQRALITDSVRTGTPYGNPPLANVDQVKAIFRPNALLQTHSLSFSGGEGKTRYLISGTYFNQDGIIRASDYSRVTGRINLTSELQKWLTAGVNLNISSATTDVVGSSGDGAGGNGGSVVRYAYFRTPVLPITDGHGNFVDKPSDYYTNNPNLYNNSFGDGYNPVGMLAYNDNKKLTNRLFGKVFIVVKPFEGFSFTSNVGVDVTSQNQRRFDRNWGTGNRINNPNRLSVSDDRNHTLTFSNFINYTKAFDQHTFTFLVGTEAIKTELYNISATDNTFANQSPTLTYLNNGLSLQKTVAESRQGNALLSYFGKVNYDYNQKYLASATFRRDGSSRFGANNRWGNFYAGSLGWRIDKEAFLESNTWINRLLLRAGYGVIGNQEIPNYAFSDAYGVNSNYPFGNTRSIGYSVKQLGNSNVKWESSSQTNIGVDLATWEGKLLVSLDYFDKITKDLLVNQPIASSSGLGPPAVLAPVVNNGKVLNRGVELAINYSNKLGDFGYSIAPNVAFLHNEVLAVNSPIPGGQYGSDYTTRTETGYQVGSFYMLKMEGIFQTPTEVFTHANQGAGIQPGDVKFADKPRYDPVTNTVHVDGIIDGNDRQHVGSAIPKVTGGLNLMLNYKNFDLSVFFQGAYGQKILSVLNRDIEGFYRPFNVTERYYQNHWTPENQSNQYPRASWNASGNNTMISTRFLENGSYTRLKNLQLGYNIPKDILKKYGFSAARIYVSGTNLFTFTKYSGMDPEMSVSNNSTTDGDKANGIDWGTYPAAKSYNVGVNITF